VGVKTFVGTYAGEIYYLEIDTTRGLMSEPVPAAKLDSPSYCVIADEKYLLACSEVDTFDGKYGGGLVSYKINNDGTLYELSRVCTGGPMPCHVAYDPASRFVAAANYDDSYFHGSFAVCELDENGMLSEPQIFVIHTGSGPDKSRQAGTHVHQCVFHGGTLWVCDLGLDVAVEYLLDGDMARKKRQLHTPPGSGARHMAIDKTGRHAYVICEMGSLIATYDLTRPGDLYPENIYKLTDGSPGRTGAAAIRYRNDGMLLATNRYKDNISLYFADGVALHLLSRTACGKTPRDGAFVPGTDLVIAGLQDDDLVALYDISSRTLEKIGETRLPRPTCFAFL